MYLTFGAKYQTLAIITRSGNVHFNITKLDKIINTLNHIFILDFLPWGHFCRPFENLYAKSGQFKSKLKSFLIKNDHVRHKIIILCRFHAKIDIFSPIQSY